MYRRFSGRARLFIIFLLFQNWGVPQISTAHTPVKTEVNQLDDISKQNMVATLAQKTGLNEAFSKM